MKLYAEVRQWRDEKTGEVVEYLTYYVDIHGIKVYMTPKDATGRQLLTQYVKNMNK